MSSGRLFHSGAFGWCCPCEADKEVRLRWGSDQFRDTQQIEGLMFPLKISVMHLMFFENLLQCLFNSQLHKGLGVWEERGAW